VNRTDRLYAIVEELRARSPRPTSAATLAQRFEVSTRTVERDLLALQEAGVPIFAEAGRAGGYVLDAARTLPPVNFSAAEAAAVAVALQSARNTPFAASARSALTKMLAAMGVDDQAAARELGARVLTFAPRGARPREPSVPAIPRAVEQAIVDRVVLRIRYRDKNDVGTRRDVEPVAVVGVEANWYLTAWCRLRDGVRAFRLDRITEAYLTRERAPARDLPPIEIPGLEGSPVLE
jgi:predicted DNA-binding transcriptional regulator YafY